MLTIRRATRADHGLLAELGRQTFSDSFAADNTPENMAAYLAEAFSPARQAAELAEPGTSFLIAETQEAGGSGQPVGYARLKAGPAPACITGRRPLEIARFYAATAWIGQGVGPALMQACLAEAARHGCDCLWLDVWEQNPRAIAFYRKWGFAVVGEQTFQLGDDLQHDLLMQRPIPGEKDRGNP